MDKTTLEKDNRNSTKTRFSQNVVRKVKQFVRKYYITWLIDLANKLYDVEKFIDFILCHVIKNCLVLLRNFVNKPVEWNSI